MYPLPIPIVKLPVLDQRDSTVVKTLALYVADPSSIPCTEWSEHRWEQSLSTEPGVAPQLPAPSGMA